MSGADGGGQRRVLYVEQNEDDTIGGSHRIMADLVTNLSSDYEPVVVFYQGNAWVERLAAAGVEVHAWDERRRTELSGGKSRGLGTLRDVAAQVRFRRSFLKSARIDAVHLNNAPFVGADAWVPACRLAGVPCMTYAMGYGPPESAVQRWLQRRFDLVFSLSRAVDEDLDRIGVPRSRRIMVHPGIDIRAERARVKRDAIEVRRAVGIGESDVLAVMVGNIREWKGQHVVVDAISRMPAEARQRLALVFVGEEGSSPAHAEYGRRLRAELCEHGLEESVSILGHRDDVPDLFGAADIAIHASIIPEPFGMVVLEAMVHGCAVIASNAGGPAEILTDGAGQMFDTRDPDQLASLLADLVLDPERRAALGVRARERAEDFALRKHVEAVEAGYRRIFRG